MSQYEDPSIQSYMEAFAKLECNDPGAIAAFATHVGQWAEDQLASFHLRRLFNGEGARDQLGLNDCTKNLISTSDSR